MRSYRFGNLLLPPFCAPQIRSVRDDAFHVHWTGLCSFQSPYFHFLAVLVDVVQEGVGEPEVVHVERADVVVFLIAEIGEMEPVQDDG